MEKDTALKIIAWIALAGIAFSGYLSYTELFAGFCGAQKLGMGQCTNVVGVPACVYGFIMYLLVLIVAVFGLKSDK